MKKTLLILILMTLLAGCSMPVTTVRTVESRPSISIVDAPADAELFVDGLPAGKAAGYNGESSVLLIEPGTHRIVVRQGSTVLYDQKIFVDSETRRISIR